MNKARLFELADVIEGEKIDGVGFTLHVWFGAVTAGFLHPTCGAVACIAGHAALLAKGHKAVDPETADKLVMKDHFVGDAFDIAIEWLGLSEETGYALFIPKDFPERKEYSDVTPEIAARVLRILAITGEVDWQTAFEPTPEVEHLIFTAAEDARNGAYALADAKESNNV